MSWRDSPHIMPLFIILSLLICYFATFPRTVFAASADEVIKKAGALSAVQRKTFLEEGAKKEGELVFYTSLSLTDYPKIMPYFEKSYPFIKTNTYRSTPSGLFTRAELASGVAGAAAGVGSGTTTGVSSSSKDVI